MPLIKPSIGRGDLQMSEKKRVGLTLYNGQITLVIAGYLVITALKKFKENLRAYLEIKKYSEVLKIKLAYVQVLLRF